MARSTHPDEEVAFLNCIAAAPRDQLTRLVYADWLDEHGKGDEAEYLRLLCQATTRSRGAVATRKRLRELRGMLDEAWCARVKRGLHERVSQGELLDAAWWIYDRHGVESHARAEELGIPTVRAPSKVRADALKALRRKCPGFTSHEYDSAFIKCRALGSVISLLVGKHGDRWFANRGSLGTCYGLVAKEYDRVFARDSPGFKLSTCRRALAWMYVNCKIR